MNNNMNELNTSELNNSDFQVGAFQVGEFQAGAFQVRELKNSGGPMIQKSLSNQRGTYPKGSELGFGKYFSDHMLCVKYANQKWETAEIRPYAPLQLDPASSVLHYGQALFEGMKAFKQENGDLVIFRPEYNWQRMKQGAERLCMPLISEDLFWQGLRALVEVDASWVPTEAGSSLYLRPTLIGTESFLGVRPSEEYLFFVILSPVSSYYGGPVQEGIKIWVEEEFVRAAPGGLGATKAAANYANSLYAAHRAKQRGFAQVLWLDVNHENVEEVGTMNVFFVFKNEIVTPDLGGTILAGGTRDSAIQLLKEWSLPITARKLSWSEVESRAKAGDLLEVFGTGTAAVVTPVAELTYQGGQETLHLPQTGFGPVGQRLFEEIQNIQFGRIPDTRNWLRKV